MSSGWHSRRQRMLQSVLAGQEVDFIDVFEHKIGTVIFLGERKQAKKKARKRHQKHLLAVLASKTTPEQRQKVLHKRHWHVIYRQVVSMQLFPSSGWKSLCFGQENAVDIWNQKNDCFERTAQAFLAENYREVQFLHCWLQAFVSRLIRDSLYPALDKDGRSTCRCQCNLMI